ncbi:Ribonuclease H-like superfamily protein [Gossypium australe]|uniref:Ribonuclease H-like superfamily protein n=1 Tax=Gossypium australe TaxID=47621 RepID=A0A5B6WUX4_9ROSI|nr:Ribonuclease H-like superfamily protein [Gossypium australe]
MIENKIVKYWWQKRAGQRGSHWCQWKLLCRAKEEGGLGLGKFLFLCLAQYWATKATLEKGLFWRVGTGVNISVYDDAWIPSCVNVKLNSGDVNASSDGDNLRLVKISDLINSQDRKWDRGLIDNTFHEEIAELILRIPLALSPHEDLRVWNGEPSGEFSVRSTYKLLQNIDPTAYVLQNFYKEFYKKLWRIDLPSKIKLLIWRISWNYLPTRVNLSNRKVTNNTLCPRCGEKDETMNHLFRECPASQAVWRKLSDQVFIMLPEAEFIEWLTKVVSILLLDKCRIYCGTLWAIWGDRNSCIHNKKKADQKLTSSERKWRHPPGQTTKINFDGAYDERKKMSASGVVVRDRNGSVLLTSTGLHSGV